jgi:hypothetical protein
MVAPGIKVGTGVIIKSIRIENYRCVSDETLACEDLVALVGPNGAGKSTFLQALSLFYEISPFVEEEDFFGHQTEEDIVITVTFGRLGADALGRFSKYVQDGLLAVARVIHWQDGKCSDKYHGSRLQRPDFGTLRTLNAAEMRSKYAELRERELFVELPKLTTKADILVALDQWEANHPDECERLNDDGQFFGFKSVAAGFLGRFTRFVLVPAVRDASTDGEEGKDSLFTELVNLVVRGDASGDAEIAALSEEVAERYRDIVSDKKAAGLRSLERDLAQSLAVYVHDSDIRLHWSDMPDVQLPPPRAVAKVGEDGHFSGVERKGHGLQRAFIMALLQLLESARTRQTGADSSSSESQRPDVVIAIEEPELYQHPDRQRHVAAVLARLASVPADPAMFATQVIYTTHSPHFVGLDRFDRVRLARKVKRGSLMTTKLSSLTLDAVAKNLAAVTGGDPSRFTGKSLSGRLHSIMTPWMNEAFFSDVAVLVEGEQDRAAILAAARMDGHEFEQIGVSVIPCIGKNNIDRPALIFRGIGIATYTVFDSDGGRPEPSRADVNRRLLRIAGATEEDYPGFVGESCACFLDKVETTLKEEIGDEDLNLILDALSGEYEVNRSDILKNPTMMTEALRRSADRGRRCTTLHRIVTQILELRSSVKPSLTTAGVPSYGSAPALPVSAQVV